MSAARVHMLEIRSGFGMMKPKLRNPDVLGSLSEGNVFEGAGSIRSREKSRVGAILGTSRCPA